MYEVGYSMTDSLENADIVIYNTCAIRENAELKIFGNIGKLKALKKANPNMIVAVCGCMVMQEHIVEKIKKSYPFVDIVFGTNAIEILPQLFIIAIPKTKSKFFPRKKDGNSMTEVPILRQSKSEGVYFQ